MRRHQHADTLPPPTSQHLDGLVCAVQQVCRRGIDERLGVFGMSAVQCRGLQLISDHPGLSQRQLSRLMGQSEQAFGTLMARLRRQGYVVAGRGSRRGAAATHELTSIGRFMQQQAQEIAHDVLVLLFMPLSREERQTLRGLLEKVLNAAWRLQFHPVPESS